MKKLIILLLCLLHIAAAWATEAEAKEKKNKKSTRYYRHEVNISYGYCSISGRSSWNDDYQRGLMKRYGLVNSLASYEEGICCQYNMRPDLSSDGSMFALSYFYHLNRRIAVGGLFFTGDMENELGYPEVRYDNEVQLRGFTTVKGHSTFIMPAFKWSWLNNRWCSLYLKTMVGLHFQNLEIESETIPEEQAKEYKAKHCSLSYVAVPFGWEIGKQKVRWFIEFGFGSNPYTMMGLTYRFKRF